MIFMMFFDVLWVGIRRFPRVLDRNEILKKLKSGVGMRLYVFWDGKRVIFASFVGPPAPNRIIHCK